MLDLVRTEEAVGRLRRRRHCDGKQECRSDAHRAQRRTETSECLLQQVAVSGLVHPRARAGRMRQGDAVRLAGDVLNAQCLPHDILQREWSQESVDRKPANGNDELRAHERELGIEPASALVALPARRNAISSAAGTRTRIAARDRGDIDVVTENVFLDAGAPQPFEERAARASREGPAAGPLDLTWC